MSEKVFRKIKDGLEEAVTFAKLDAENARLRATVGERDQEIREMQEGLDAAYNMLAARRATVEELTRALERIASDDPTREELWDIARAALAKAKGGE